jgi:SAM-dependent methyltransferase
MTRALVAVLAVAAFGRLATGQTPDIHFVPTPPEVVDAMLAGAKVTSNDVVYDLGSGDGRIVLAAAQKFGARGVGIEINGALVREARLNAAFAGLAEQVTFIEGDLFKADLSEATVITMFLSPSVNLRLRTRLRDLRPGVRLVSHRFPIEGWPPDREIKVGEIPVLFWTVPAGPAR